MEYGWKEEEWEWHSHTHTRKRIEQEKNNKSTEEKKAYAVECDSGNFPFGSPIINVTCMQYLRTNREKRRFCVQFGWDCRTKFGLSPVWCWLEWECRLNKALIVVTVSRSHSQKYSVASLYVFQFCLCTTANTICRIWFVSIEMLGYIVNWQSIDLNGINIECLATLFFCSVSV